MEYLFYRLWQLLIGKSEEDIPPFGSMMILWMLIIFNIQTIELLLYNFYNFGFTPKDKNEVVLYSLIPITFVLIFNILFLFRRRNKIKLKYENESSLKKRIGNIILFAYGILSIVIFFILGNLFPIR
jgi:ABC-type Fe3+ transport system permease subunit